MTQADIEKRLETLLHKLALPLPVTVPDIKEAIWNAQKNGASELFFMLSPNAKDQETVREIMQVTEDAWNYFPHRMLEGKSPIEVMNEYQENGNIDQSRQISLPKRGKSLHDAFENQYPKTVIFEKISEDTWGWGFPKLHHDLTDELWELEESNPSTPVFEKELYRMIKQMPELFDAVNNLAHIYGKKHEFGLAKALYQQTITKARSYIPDTFIPGKDRAIWAYMSNRPFLRLLAGYASLIEKFENAVKAIPLYEEILSFNPNDNQGIRAPLSTVYLKTNQPEKVIELASHYEDSMTPELVMGELLAYVQLGEHNNAKLLLERIKEHQSHVIKELLKQTHPAPAILIPDQVKLGGEDEAYYFWKAQGQLWQQTPGAIDFLREQTKDIQAQIISLTDEEVLAVNFFHDFLTFLDRLKERPMKLTETGNISLKDIDPLIPAMKMVKEVFEYHQKEWGVKPRKEDEIIPLHLIRVMTEVMHLTHKRQGKLLLSKNGKAFLENLSPVDQFSQLFQYYTQKLNWTYYTYGNDKQAKLTELLQAHQDFVWRLLKEKGTTWIDYKTFCETLRDQLRLQPLLEETYSKSEDILTRRINNILFARILTLFGCVELKTKEMSKWDTTIIRFRLTKIGMAILK